MTMPRWLSSVAPSVRGALRAPGARSTIFSRLSSNSSGSDDAVAQQSLDELAGLLERQPQANARPPRAPRSKPSAQTQTETMRGPSKVFQDGHTLGPDYLRPRPRRQLPPLLGPTKRDAMKKDPIHILGLNPAKPSLADDSYKNGAILQQFVTEMGRMQPRNITGLTRKSQRQVGKALRRAHAMGILPVLARGQGRSGGGWR